MDFHFSHQTVLLSNHSNIDDDRPPQIKKSISNCFPLDVAVRNWEDVVCPICLNYPHNSVLLLCTSYEKGCRPFICDTNHLHSNCLDRFKAANGMPSKSEECPPSTLSSGKPAATAAAAACPLCRGEVNGWVIISEAREYFNENTRCCAEERCGFTGTYSELQQHAKLEHQPDSHPSRIDPARRLEWENFQETSDLIDILSIIQTEAPHGVVLGDYVIEYGDGDDHVGGGIGGEFDDVSGDEGSRSWASCIWHHVFDNLRRRRRRSRSRESSGGSRGNRGVGFNSDDGSVIEFPGYRGEEPHDNDDDDDDDEEFVTALY